jgi:ABC-2 type transport system permease protein
MSDAAAESPLTAEALASRPAAIPAWQVMVALIRREFWEHRALWTAPLITGGLMVLSTLLVHMGRNQWGTFPVFVGPGSANSNPHALGVMISSARQIGVSVPLYLAAVVTVFFYLLSSLYDERKDRSILFWKSLPVSDAATVLSKLLVALVVVPLGVFVAAIVTDVLQRWVWDIRYALGLVGGPEFIWDTLAWAKVEAFMLLVLALAVLWYAPIAAYLMVISAWARRNAFLWAVLPPVILTVVERIAFGTRYVTDLLLYRLGGVWFDLWNNFRGHGGPDSSFWKQHTFPSAFDMVSFRDLFTNVDLWLGLIVAAALVYAAIRIRRYRDDT